MDKLTREEKRKKDLEDLKDFQQFQRNNTIWDKENYYS